MQFAGQRTDESLTPIGEPHNILVKLADDVLPEPDAILVHGVTPQKANAEGISEAEFSKFFTTEIAESNTIFVGYNNIRFDDEFIRFALYRNFYDPYQWHWQDNKSRWDLLDPIRMMRALRPEGLRWPFIDGKPTVKLELMARENDLLHENAHDALSDVQALIQLAQLFRKSQPKLFEYLLSYRDKKKVAELILAGNPFVYTSGKYSSDYEKTTIVKTIMKHPRRDAAIVYNLRDDPSPWLSKSVDELIKHWKARYDEALEQLPVKTVQFNRCPAIAPLSVIDDVTEKRLGFDMGSIRKHEALLNENAAFTERLTEALDTMEKAQQTALQLEENVDQQLYDEFWTPADHSELALIRGAEVNELAKLVTSVKNKRIRALLPRYQARNFPRSLTPEQHEEWDDYRRKLFYAGGNTSMYGRFSKRMQEISKTRSLTQHEQYLLTELQLYVESILPEPDEA